MHYCVPPLARLDVDELLLLIQQRKYFVLHAPRQTGKTSALLALRDALNADDEYRCAYVNVEGGQSAREDVGAAMRAILSALARSARETLNDGFVAEVWPDILDTAGPHDALRELLARWCESSPRPLVLMFDEIDALVGDTLIAVLRHAPRRLSGTPGAFPAERRLVRRQGRARLSDPVVCRERGHRRRECLQHPRRVPAARRLLSKRCPILACPAHHGNRPGIHRRRPGRNLGADPGQPWLVNAIAFEASFKDRTGRDRDHAISADAIQDARKWVSTTTRPGT